MTKRLTGFLQISSSNINDYSCTTSVNTDGVVPKSGNTIFNSWQIGVTTDISADAELVLTPQGSYKGTIYFPITNAGTLTLNSTTTAGVIDFQSVFPYTRLAITKSGTENPTISAQYVAAEAYTIQPKAVSAGAVSCTSLSASGNTSLAGTLAVTGNTTLTGDVTTSANHIKSYVNYSSGAGALPITADTIFLTTSGAEALTLADGVAGQELEIVMVADGGDGTLTPDNFGNGSTILFANVGDSIKIKHDGTNWWIIGTPTATVS